MNKKFWAGIVIVAFFVGAIGSIVLGRFVIPYFANFKNLTFLNRISSAAPIIINRREQVQLNEGANLIDLSKQAGNFTVSFYKGSGQNYKFVSNGIIMSNDGMIFTTREVGAPISGQLVAVLNDGTSYPATIKAVDPRSDLVVVTIPAKDLAVGSLAEAKSLQVGQRIVGVGQSSREQLHEFLTGFVTKTMDNNTSPDRVFLSQAFEETFTIGANLSSDYTGGPVINLDGRIVGMITGGKVLPAEDLQTALSSYLSTGKIIRPFIGIKYLNLSKSLAKLINLPTSGILVLTVDNSSAAQRAGIAVNDFLTAVDNVAIDANNSFEYLFNNHPISAMKLKILRAGQEMEISVQPDSNQ